MGVGDRTDRIFQMEGRVWAKIWRYRRVWWACCSRVKMGKETFKARSGRFCLVHKEARLPFEATSHMTMDMVPLVTLVTL